MSGLRVKLLQALDARDAVALEDCLATEDATVLAPGQPPLLTAAARAEWLTTLPGEPPVADRRAPSAEALVDVAFEPAQLAARDVARLRLGSGEELRMSGTLRRRAGRAVYELLHLAGR